LSYLKNPPQELISNVYAFEKRLLFPQIKGTYYFQKTSA